MPRELTIARAAAFPLVVACALSLSAAAGAERTTSSRLDPGSQGYHPDQRPRWSPDGRWLAFTRGTGTIDLPWISLIDRRGTRMRRPQGYYGPFWSPDGERMATLNGRSLWLGDGDGSRQRRVGAGRYGGAWSPDGSLFAFSLGRLYVVNPDGSGLRRLPIDVPSCSRCSSSEDDPAWSPNGRTLAFEHGEAEPGSKGVGAIWAADVDGRNLRRLSDWFNAYGPRWSADGTKIAYLMDDGFGDVSYLHIVNLDGSNDRRYRSASTFSWAPRGALLAYETASFPTRVLVVRPGSGRTVTLKRAAEPAWAPDGNRLAFRRRGSIYVSDANGRRERRLASGTQPNWSPEGRLIVYAGARCGPHQGIQLITVDGKRHKRLTDFCFIVGTDGRDELRGTTGTDRVLAAAGNDLIFVRDHRRDVVSCGGGRDRVIADQLDQLAGCERIER